MSNKSVRVIIFLLLTLFTNTSTALYSTKSDVIELSPNNFDDLVLKSSDIWIVEFYAPWCSHCQNFISEYTKVATTLKGIVKVAAINADDYKHFVDKYDIKSYPTIKIFGKNKKTPEEVSNRNAKDIIDRTFAVMKQQLYAKLKTEPRNLPHIANDITELTDDNFQNLVLDSKEFWMVNFLAPCCEHCKKLEPEWSQAAVELKGKIHFGFLDATVYKAIAVQNDIRGYPTIKLFVPDQDSYEYVGVRTAYLIVDWALEKVVENAETLIGSQIIDYSSFTKSCLEKTLCIVSILPELYDCPSDCRNKYIKTINILAEKHKRNTWGWMWAEAGAQPDLESSLDIGGFGYPAVAIINTRKMKYSIFLGSFSKEGINNFLKQLCFGSRTIRSVKEFRMPQILQSIAWNEDGVTTTKETETVHDEHYEL